MLVDCPWAAASDRPQRHPPRAQERRWRSRPLRGPRDVPTGAHRPWTRRRCRRERCDLCPALVAMPSWPRPRGAGRFRREWSRPEFAAAADPQLRFEDQAAGRERLGGSRRRAMSGRRGAPGPCRSWARCWCSCLCARKCVVGLSRLAAVAPGARWQLKTTSQTPKTENRDAALARQRWRLMGLLARLCDAAAYGSAWLWHVQEHPAAICRPGPQRGLDDAVNGQWISRATWRRPWYRRCGGESTTPTRCRAKSEPSILAPAEAPLCRR